MCDSRSRFLRCSPASFDAGSDPGKCDGRFEEATVHLIDIKSLVDCGACGYVGEGEHFPACRACSGSGGSGAGRRSRSSTYPQAFLINLPRRAISEALVLALLIVQGDEITPIRSRNSRFSTRGIRGSGVLFMSMR